MEEEVCGIDRVDINVDAAVAVAAVSFAKNVSFVEQDTGLQNT